MNSKHLTKHWVIWRPKQTLDAFLRDAKAHAVDDTIGNALPEAKG